jgi:hypothetical protein
MHAIYSDLKILHHYESSIVKYINKKFNFRPPSMWRKMPWKFRRPIRPFKALTHITVEPTTNWRSDYSYDSRIMDTFDDNAFRQNQNKIARFLKPNCTEQLYQVIF